MRHPNWLLLVRCLLQMIDFRLLLMLQARSGLYLRPTGWSRFARYTSWSLRFDLRVERWSSFTIDFCSIESITTLISCCSVIEWISRVIVKWISRVFNQQISVTPVLKTAVAKHLEEQYEGTSSFLLNNKPIIFSGRLLSEPTHVRMIPVALFPFEIDVHRLLPSIVANKWAIDWSYRLHDPPIRPLMIFTNDRHEGMKVLVMRLFRSMPENEESDSCFLAIVLAIHFE